jgi:hypothetical protein
VPSPPEYVAGHRAKTHRVEPGQYESPITGRRDLQLTRRHLLACCSWRTVEVG